MLNRMLKYFLRTGAVDTKLFDQLIPAAVPRDRAKLIEKGQREALSVQVSLKTDQVRLNAEVPVDVKCGIPSNRHGGGPPPAALPGRPRVDAFHGDQLHVTGQDISRWITEVTAALLPVTT